MYETALFVQLLVFIVVSSYLVTRRCFSIYHPAVLYAGFHFIVFVLRPILASYFNYDAGIYSIYRFFPTADIKVTTILASMLGFVVFTLVSTQIGASPVRFAAPETHETGRRQHRDTFLVIAAILGPIAIYSLQHTYRQAIGDVEFTMIMSRASGHYLNTTGNGYAVDAQMLAVPLCALCAWMFRYRLLAFLPIIAFVLLRAGTGNRGPFVASLVTLGLLYAYEKRIRLPNWKVLSLLLAAAMLFRTVGDDRGASVRGVLQNSPAASWANTEVRDNRFLESMDYQNEAFLQYIIWVVPEKSQTYDYFLDNLEVLVAPIPRVLWPGKPDAEPFPQVRLFEFGFPIGMTKSLPGEGWFALGWIGVILWCGLAGYILGRLYEKFAVGRSNIFFTLGYLCFFPSLIISFRDGQLISVMRQSVWYVLPVILWWAYARQRADKNVQRKSGHGPHTPASVQPDTSFLASLPPAVRRRRLALANKPESPSA